MPSRIFRSSISPFHDTLSCVCDLLFSALGFLLQLLVEPRFQNAFLYTTIRRVEKPALPSQRGVPCISGEPVSVALLNCENLSLVDCQTCCALSMPAVGHALLCLLLAMLFFACCWPCSSLPAVGHALLCLLLAMLFFACCWPCSSFVDSSDRIARVIRACCLLSRNGFAVRLLRLYLWAVLQIAMPTLCSSCATGCSLLPARVIRACFLLTRIRSSG